MSDEIREVLAAVRAGVGGGDVDAVEDGIAQLEFFIVEEGWPDDLFDGVSGLLGDPAFLGIPASYRIARLPAARSSPLTASDDSPGPFPKARRTRGLSTS